MYLTIWLGGLCGAAFLDYGFEKELCTVITRKRWEKVDDSHRKMIMNDWELVKRKWDYQDRTEITIPLPSAMIAPFPVEALKNLNLLKKKTDHSASRIVGKDLLLSR